MVTLSGSRQRGSDRAEDEPCAECPGRLARLGSALIRLARLVAGVAAFGAAFWWSWLSWRRSTFVDPPGPGLEVWPRAAETLPDAGAFVELRVTPLDPVETAEAIAREQSTPLAG